MSAPDERAPALVGREIKKAFHRGPGEIVQALGGVSLEARAGRLTALVGPDGGGKTTLIRLAAGLLTADAGELTVLGVDVSADPQQVQTRIAYMPQRFGLYEDLTVQENLDLYADLHGVTVDERRERFARLMEMTALGPFTGRLAGRLSGGMKQKLGLACTLVRSPELLLLDEPTVGVDPLSRRELWQIIRQLVDEEGLTVLLSTSYLDEAERCQHAVVLHQGKVLTQGPPAEISRLAAGRAFLAEPPPGQNPRGLQARLLDESRIVDAVPEGGRVRVVCASDDEDCPASVGGVSAAAALEPVPPRFEDGFMMLLWQTAGQKRPAAPQMSLERPPQGDGGQPVVEARNLVRKFGDFTAVDDVSFEVRRGEVFGLMGPNGAGKTTTFRMLCGLSAATAGMLRVAGSDLRRAGAQARERVGYVAQKFSLYGQLTVTENLEFFASAYGLHGSRRSERVKWALHEFELSRLAGLPSGQLPGGYRQRLAMAAALLHEPEILFLDEPTSGADPLARREFWRRITSLAEQGVTVVVTTHFMEEAEYCDRVAIMDAGHVLAEGAPAELRRRAHAAGGRAPTMEDAFIAVVEEARNPHFATPLGEERPAEHAPRAQQDLHPGRSWTEPANEKAGPENANRHRGLRATARRTGALVRKEIRQIVRDSSSIAIGIVMPVLLIALFGYALSLDVRLVPIAIVLEDPSPDAAELAAGFRLSSYFDARLMTSMAQAQRLMLDREVDGIVRIRPDFARRLSHADAEVQVIVHGTDANRARIIERYAQGAVAQWMARQAAEGRVTTAGPVALRDRMWFNEINESRYFLVPGLIVLIMTLIGALLTALVMSREWERGTLESLFVSPVRVEEILLGKTIPYFVLGMTGLALCLLAGKFLFQVPFRGSVLVLAGVSILYLLVALGIGLLISSAVKSQFVASQLTLLVTFLPALMLSGFLFDLRSMPAVVRLMTYALPARYYVALLQTVFLAGDVCPVIVPNAAVLGGMAAALLALTRLTTRKKLA